jgi:hypothetical protein
VAASRERRTPAFLARELIFLAEAHRRSGAAPSVVQPLVDEALAVAGPLGVEVVVADVDRFGLSR